MQFMRMLSKHRTAFMAAGKVLSQLIKPVETKSLPFVSPEAVVYPSLAHRPALDEGWRGKLD